MLTDQMFFGQKNSPVIIIIIIIIIIIVTQLLRGSAFGCFIGHLSPPSRGFIHLLTQLRMFGCAMAGCLSDFWRMLSVETSESGKLTWKTHRILIWFTRKDCEFRYVSLPEDKFCKVVDGFFVGGSYCVYSYGYHLCWGSSPFCKEWLGFLCLTSLTLR